MSSIDWMGGPMEATDSALLLRFESVDRGESNRKLLHASSAATIDAKILDSLIGHRIPVQEDDRTTNTGQA